MHTDGNSVKYVCESSNVDVYFSALKVISALARLLFCIFDMLILVNAMIKAGNAFMTGTITRLKRSLES